MTKRFARCVLLLALAAFGPVLLLAQENQPTTAAEKAAPKDEAASDAKPAEANSETDKKPNTDKKPDTDKKPATENSPPSVTKPAAAPAIDKQAALAAWDAKLQEWKDLLKDLRDQRVRYSVADETEAEDIRKRWDQTVQMGRQMIGPVRQAAMNAYAAAPNQDRQLTRFLVQMLSDEVAHDNYEPAAELAQVLIDNNCDAKEIYSLGGIAAFATNDFDKAEEHLNTAKDLGEISETGTQYLGLIDKYKEYWATEKELREKEAAANDLPRVKLTTNKGDIVIELLENEAPETVGNFVSLVEKGFYNGLDFHRVLPAFMAQGGDPSGDGTGGSDYSIYCECYKPEHRKHFRGSLSMAHAGKNTGGSQFFLTFVPTDHLNGMHTVFGRVVEGMDVLAKLQRRDPSGEPPLATPDEIVTAEVLRKRDHEYVPNKVTD